MNETIDALQLNLGGGGLMIMNVSLAVIMFGVALELKISNFKAIAEQPRGVLAGFISQFMFLPAVTFALIWLLEPYPSFALGMMMVAACPGGNISNFFSQLAGGKYRPFRKPHGYRNLTSSHRHTIEFYLLG